MGGSQGHGAFWHGGDTDGTSVLEHRRQLRVSSPLETGQGAMVPSPGLCDKGDVEFIRVEDEGPPRRARVPVGLVEQLEEPGADVHGDPHDDALGHP